MRSKTEGLTHAYNATMDSETVRIGRDGEMDSLDIKKIRLWQILFLLGNHYCIFCEEVKELKT